jgi:hypothetical protein
MIGFDAAHAIALAEGVTVEEAREAIRQATEDLLLFRDSPSEQWEIVRCAQEAIAVRRALLDEREP